MKINSPSYPWLPICLSPEVTTVSSFLNIMVEILCYVSVVLCPQKNFIFLFLKAREDLSVFETEGKEKQERWRLKKQITEELLSEELREVGEGTVCGAGIHFMEKSGPSAELGRAGCWQ